MSQYTRVQARQMSCSAGQQGIAVFYAIFTTLIMTLLLATSMAYTYASMQSGRHQLTKNVQAKSVAQTGLQMAHLWFTQQAVQPVKQQPDPVNKLWPDMAFNPKYDAIPAVSETDDKTGKIGLVRDYQISNDRRLWGHYEVHRQSTNNDPGSGGSAANNDPYAVRDVSHLRTAAGATNKGAGLVWRITSYGYVYIRNDFTAGSDGVYTVPYNQAPNKVVDGATAQMEIQHLALKLPPACVVYDGGSLTLNSRAKLIDSDNQPAIVYGGKATAPVGVASTQPGANTQGTPAVSSQAATNLAPDVVFGVSQNDLQNLADQSVTKVSDLSLPLPDMGLIFINGSATFDSTNRLSGGGILYVTGDLTIPQDAGASFSGVIYVGGNVTIGGGNSITGTLAFRGNGVISATADYAEVDYSAALLSMLQSRLGTYRANNMSLKIQAM